MKIENQPDLQEIFTRAAFREIDNEHYDSAKRLFKSSDVRISYNLAYFFGKDLGSERYEVPASPAERPANYSFVDFLEAINAVKCVKAAGLAQNLQFDREKAKEFFQRLVDENERNIPTIMAP